MIVHKFGGTSVGDAQCFANVAEIVLEQSAARDTIVVLSAMSGVTNALIAGARAAADGRDDEYRTVKATLLRRHLDVVETLLPNGPLRLEVGGFVEDRLHELERLYRSIAVLGELTVRGSDAVAAFGEPLSTHILAAVLRQRGTRAQAVSAAELVVTDDHFGTAAPLWEPTQERLQARLRPLVEQGLVPIVTGYIGATAAGVTTTLGRGGSDYSAALLGAGLDADEVWIWSDVDGILTADPNIVPQARTLAELSYAEAADLAYFGADVLHPKTIRPVVEHGIPLRILNTFRPAHPGTLIVRTPRPERRPLPAIISSAGLSLVAVGSVDDSWSLPMAARVLQCLAAASVEVPMFSQSFSEHSLNLILREQDRAHGLRLLRQELAAALQDGSCALEARERVATVSVVGMPGWNHAGIVAHAFAALGKLGTRVIAVAQAATEHSVSFCIPEEQLADTVRFLHRELGLEDGDE
jgi:aspartokinase/homoserine dehydrogenase 1